MNFLVAVTTGLIFFGSTQLLAEKLADTAGDQLVQNLQASDSVIVNINLKKYEMDVQRNGKSIGKFPVSWGGPEAMPKCDPETNGSPCPTPPRECLGFSNPPVGEFPVNSALESYRSQILNAEYKNVIRFGKSWVIRALNQSASAKIVGGSQFTCGHIVLRSGDAQRLQQAISSSDLKFFKVRVSN